MTQAIFVTSGLLMFGGIACVALSAMLFKDNEPTQDVYDTDSPKEHHWTMLWAGAIMFAIGVIMSLVGSIIYVVEKLI